MEQPLQDEFIQISPPQFFRNQRKASERNQSKVLILLTFAVGEKEYLPPKTALN